MTRIERVTSPLPRECSTTEPHGPRVALSRCVGLPAGSPDAALGSPRISLVSSCPYGVSGAGEGNRTLVVSLEGFCSTIELHPPDETDLSLSSFIRPVSCLERPREKLGGGGWIRTSVGVSQQIYSLPPLTTRAPLRGEPQIMVC